MYVGIHHAIPLSSSEDEVVMLAYKYILYNSALLNLWQKFGDGLYMGVNFWPYCVARYLRPLVEYASLDYLFFHLD